MDGLGARLRRDLSSSWCKLFPKSPGCDDSSDDDHNNNGGSRGNNNKPTTTAKATSQPPPKTTSSSVKQSKPTTTSVRYAGATSTTPQAASPTTVAAAPAVQNSPDNVAAPAPTTAQQQQQQQQQQQASPEPNTTSPAAGANTPQPASTTPTIVAANTAPSVSPEPAPNGAVTAVAAGAGTGSPASDAASTTSQSAAEGDLLVTTSSGVPVITGTRGMEHPTSTAVPGAVVNDDGGRLAHNGGTTSNKTPAVVGAVVGVILLAVIAALIYRYRRSRVVRPVLLPFACVKRRKRDDGSAATSDPSQQTHQPVMREKTSRENLLVPGSTGGSLLSPTYSSAPPYSPASPTEQWLAQNHAFPPVVTLPATTYQPREDGRRRVAIPREQRLVPLGDRPGDPATLAAGFSIPPSEPDTRRNSASSASSLRTRSAPHNTDVNYNDDDYHGAHNSSSRPYSTFSAGNESVASSGVLCPVMMAWPVLPPSVPRATAPMQSQPRSPLSSEFSSNGTWMTARSKEQGGGGGGGEGATWPRHIAMYHDDDRAVQPR